MPLVLSAIAAVCLTACATNQQTTGELVIKTTTAPAAGPTVPAGTLRPTIPARPVAKVVSAPTTGPTQDSTGSPRTVTDSGDLAPAAPDAKPAKADPTKAGPAKPTAKPSRTKPTPAPDQQQHAVSTETVNGAIQKVSSLPGAKGAKPDEVSVWLRATCAAHTKGMPTDRIVQLLGQDLAADGHADPTLPSSVVQTALTDLCP